MFNELPTAIKLLKEYVKIKPDFLKEGVRIELQAKGRMVILEVEGCRMWTFDGNGKLAEWFDCGACGQRGFYKDSEDYNSSYAPYCSYECMKM